MTPRLPKRPAVAVAAVLVAGLLTLLALPGDRSAPPVADSATDGATDRSTHGATDGGTDGAADGVAGLVASGLRERPPSDADLAAVKADHGLKSRCTASTPQDCLVVSGDGPHVVLIGDSHARMYGSAVAALAREHDFAFSMNTVPGCPFQDGVMVTQGRGGDRAACVRARTDLYTVGLPAMEPDVVLLAGAAKSRPGWHGTVIGPDGATRHPVRILRRTTRATLALIRAAGARTVFLRTAMGTEGWGKSGFDPLACLAEADRVRACAVTRPRRRPAEDAIYAALARAEDVATVDPTPIYCPRQRTCRAVLDGVPVWRNTDHLNPGLLVDRRDRLWRRLVATGMLGAGVVAGGA